MRPSQRWESLLTGGGATDKYVSLWLCTRRMENCNQALLWIWLEERRISLECNGAFNSRGWSFMKFRICYPCLLAFRGRLLHDTKIITCTFWSRRLARIHMQMVGKRLRAAAAIYRCCSFHNDLKGYRVMIYTCNVNQSIASHLTFCPSRARVSIKHHFSHFIIHSLHWGSDMVPITER